MYVMKLDCIVSACNMNPLYCDFIPPFIKAWKTLYPNVDVRIILISDILPSELQQYAEHIILFTPLILYFCLLLTFILVTRNITLTLPKPH